MNEACEKRATNILEISGNKYAFDSTTIPLCLATFPWAKFRRKKGGVKAHVAIITYCFVTIVQRDMHLKRSTYEVFTDSKHFYNGQN